MITWGRWYWPAWIVTTVIAFGIPELYALFTNPGDTLSDYSWAELHITHGIPFHSLAWGMSFCCWLLFVVVITLHIWFQGV